MLKSKELRVRAWESLKGKYWMAFAVIIVTGLIGSAGEAFVTFGQELSGVLGLVDPSELDSIEVLGALLLNGVVIVSSIIGTVLSIFVTNAITVGVSNYFIKNTDSKPSFADAFSGFKVRYGRNIGTLLLVVSKHFYGLFYL